MSKENTQQGTGLRGLDRCTDPTASFIPYRELPDWAMAVCAKLDGRNMNHRFAEKCKIMPDMAQYSVASLTILCQGVDFTL
jgi:hypothetical protein